MVDPGLLLLGLASAVAILKKRLGYVLTAVGSAVTVYYALAAHPQAATGLFYIAAGFIWILSSAYSVFYDQKDWLAPLYALSILGMALALTTDNYLVFLSGYEVMSLSAYAAVGLYSKTDYPAFLFMAFGELSTLLVLAGFLYAYAVTGSLSFETIPALGPFIICALGFIVKMGVLPFALPEWLPIAHGSAPSNFSSLLSASMTLVAAYGLVKVMVLSPTTQTFGFLLMGIGAFAIFFGSLYGYVSVYNKALLGFSTVESSGAFLTLVGVYASAPTAVLSSFALTSAAVYVLAHSVAKSGLFLLSGITETHGPAEAVGTKNTTSQLGAIMLTASMSGLLPTVGGVATWALLQSLFMESYVLHSFLSTIPIVAGSVAAMGEGFAFSSMLRYVLFTQVFVKERGQENPRSITVFVAGLSAVAAGSLTILTYANFLLTPALGVLGLVASKFGASPFGAISPLYVLVLTEGFWLAILAVVGKPKTRASDTWNGGVPLREAYTPFAYSNNIRLMLRKILVTNIRGGMVEILNVSWFILHRLSQAFAGFSRELARKYMNSRIGWYVVYMILALIVVTLVVVL